MYFFEPFPTTSYIIDQESGRSVDITDITVHSKVVNFINNRTAVYYDYTIQESDRPDTIAFKYYGDSSLDWVIFLVNQVIDPLFEWPMGYEVLVKHIESKYGSVAAAMDRIVLRQWILSPKKTLADGTVVPERTINVDQATFDSLPANERRAVTAAEYEIEQNDLRRRIVLLKKEHLVDFVNEYRGIYG